eukprot:g21314.t1
MQPIDQMYDIKLNSKQDYKWLRETLDHWKPILTIFEPECRLWSNLTNLNYWWRPQELEQLRSQAMITVQEVAKCISDIMESEPPRYFLLENPHGGKLWEQPAIVDLIERYGLYYDHGHMCAYGLRGRNHELIKKATGWLSNDPHLLQACCRKCPGNHQHEPCLGGNAQKAAVYTKALARSIIRNFTELLHSLGDERFIHAYTSWPAEETFDADETEPYPDLNKDVDLWRPMLLEAAQRLEGKVAQSAEIRSSAYKEQIKNLTPWHLEYVQIYRLPKTRRMPTRKILETPNITHRGAVLLFQDGSIEVESQDLSKIKNPQSRFDRTVRVAIFLYGKPMIIETTAQRKMVRFQKDQPPAVEAAETLEHWQAGAKDMTFPGITVDQATKILLCCEMRKQTFRLSMEQDNMTFEMHHELYYLTRLLLLKLRCLC